MGVLAAVVCTLSLFCCGVFVCAPAVLPLADCGATENLLEQEV
jgi:hypothetical protein